MPRKKTCPARRAGWLRLALTLAAGWLTAAASVYAASIGVSPTLIELGAGESVSGLRVSNDDAVQAVSVQARLVRWHQEAGEDVYTPAEAVVASPPVSRVQPGAENLIRIVRTAKTPVVGEESYRLLIDQLPEPGAQAAGTVSMLIRHSVPVFVAGANVSPAQPQWRIERTEPHTDAQDPTQNRPRGWQVVVTNRGDSRLRLSSLDLLDAAGRVVGARPGLVGYALGGSTMRFFVAENDAGSAAAHTELRVSVQSEASAKIDTGLLPVAAP